MKKQYIIPQANITKINPVRVIATSFSVTSAGNTSDSGITEGNTRESNGWDDIWD